MLDLLRALIQLLAPRGGRTVTEADRQAEWDSMMDDRQ